MKNLSLKTKLNFWYIFIIALILIFTFGLLMISMQGYTDITVINTLRANVGECVIEINRDGIEEIYDEDFDFYRNGIDLVVMKDGSILNGRVPTSINESIDFLEGGKEISTDSGNWYVYDQATNFEGIYVRGYMPISTLQTFNLFILRLFIALIPILLVISFIVGYIITKKTLDPVEKIIDTAINISNGDDLSKRINLGYEGKNEIGMMASTFDEMFSRLENSFEKEKKFTSDASHELRTPVSVILASCDYALHQDNPKRQKEALELIQKQGEKLSTLISQLLMITRFDFNRIKLENEKINLKEVIESVCDEMQLKANEKNITLNYYVDEDIIIYSDVFFMMRIFINLVSNAIKYGKENGYVNIKADKENEKIVCVVEDNGIGISDENIDKIWERFYQVNPSRDNDDSLGLGLSMVKMIVMKIGGTISVESQEGIGTKFKIIF